MYAGVTPQNSAVLPAHFVLKLRSPMPMCVALAKLIQQVTEVECGDFSAPQPLLSLLTQHCSAGALDCANNKGLFVVSHIKYYELFTIISSIIYKPIEN
jgi:mediator of RNA polymerase II transcription subunit 1